MVADVWFRRRTKTIQQHSGEGDHGVDRSSIQDCIAWVFWARRKVASLAAYATYGDLGPCSQSVLFHRI